jgi:probable rRNA maturation factor
MVVLKKRVPGLNEASLDRFLGRARRAVGLRGKVTVLVTTNRALRVLNQRFRDRDQPTDVLSFPAETSIALDFAGDLAISAEIAARNARRLGHAPAEEIKILALHGILHLAGYDHENDRGEMARLEEKLRRKLRLPVALIERAAGAPGRKITADRIPKTSAPTKKRSNQPASSRVLAVRRPAR